MRIGIDGNEANVEKKVGISEYAFQLLTEFTKNTDSKNLFQIYLKDNPRVDLPVKGDHVTYRIVKPSKLWTQIGLPKDLFFHKPRPDVFFSPNHYAPRFSPIPTVISIMDLAFLKFPELFQRDDLYQLINWTKYSVKKAHAIIAISQSTKNDIIKEYHIPQEKVHVVYLGIKEVSRASYKSMEELSKKYSVSKPYILFVGTLQPRKNVSKLIEAYSKVVSSIQNSSPSKDLQLVIIGKKGWMYEEIIEAPKKFDVETRVKFLDFVPDSDLPSFYKHAEMYVLPSLYEGFGLPVLEAMKYGCPVLTSNISSLPEAGGDAALYFDPTDTHDIAKTIEKVLTNEKLRDDMIKKGYEHIKKFSWQKTAKEVLSVLEGVGSK